MERHERTERYRKIEEHRDRPLIVYATSTRTGVQGFMAGDAVREFLDQIDNIEAGDSIDVLIHSTGGDALAAWKLMSVLRERFDNVGVLVPLMAFSAATIFALGADEIVMHPHASLGPIDPQIGVRQSDGGMRHFSFEDVGAFLRFLKEDVKVTEQAYVQPIMDRLFSEADPIVIGGAKRASELSTDVGERLLQMHMTDPEEKGGARKIAEDLNKTFFAHGDAVSRTRARELNLKINDDDAELEELIWEAYLGLESHMELRTPFNALQHFLADQAAAEVVQARKPLRLPPNSPEELVQQAWNAAANKALSELQEPAQEVEFSVVNALIESPRLGSEYRTEGTISAARVAGGEIVLSVTDRVSGWRPLTDGTVPTESEGG